MAVFSINTLLLFRFMQIHSIALRERGDIELCKKNQIFTVWLQTHFLFQVRHKESPQQQSCQQAPCTLSIPVAIFAPQHIFPYIPNAYFWHISLYFFFLRPYWIMNSIRAMTFTYLKISFNRDVSTTLDLEAATPPFASNSTLSLSINLLEAWFLIIKWR